MPFLPGDLKFYGSSGGNLGGSPTAEIPDNSLHLVFPPLSRDDLERGKEEYRCIFLVNTTDNKTFFSVTVEVSGPPDGSRNPVETITLGLDPQKGSPIQQIPNSRTPPTGVTFFDRPIEIGILGPNEVQGIWLKRTVPPNTQPAGFVKVTLKVSGYSLEE